MQVADDLFVACVTDWVIRTAGHADAERIRGSGVDVIVGVGVLDPLRLEAGEIQDFRGYQSNHSSAVARLAQ
jgi:hypothetical protein